MSMASTLAGKLSEVSIAERAARKRISALEREARFLIARLSELSFDDAEDTYRDFCGHVEPSIARLRSLLDEK